MKVWKLLENGAQVARSFLVWIMRIISLKNLLVIYTKIVAFPAKFWWIILSRFPSKDFFFDQNDAMLWNCWKSFKTVMSNMSRAGTASSYIVQVQYEYIIVPWKTSSVWKSHYLSYSQQYLKIHRKTALLRIFLCEVF